MSFKKILARRLMERIKERKVRAEEYIKLIFKVFQKWIEKYKVESREGKPEIRERERELPSLLGSRR